MCAKFLMNPVDVSPLASLFLLIRLGLVRRFGSSSAHWCRTRIRSPTRRHSRVLSSMGPRAAVNAGIFPRRGCRRRVERHGVRVCSRGAFYIAARAAEEARSPRVVVHGPKRLSLTPALLFSQSPCPFVSSCVLSFPPPLGSHESPALLGRASANTGGSFTNTTLTDRRRSDLSWVVTYATAAKRPRRPTRHSTLSRRSGAAEQPEL